MNEDRAVELTWPTDQVAPYALLLRDNQQIWFLPFLDTIFGYIPSQTTDVMASFL